jgi:hypothetical protein
VHPPPTTQQQREELQRKEDARREEQDRKNVEAQLSAFDAHEFYDAIEGWTKKPIPRPIQKRVRLTPLKTKVIMRQPIPLTGRDLNEMHKLSTECARLLYLLRAIDQRGIECPYVHQVSRPSLEKALDKCQRLEDAGMQYAKNRGILSRLWRMFSGTSVEAMKKDIDSFRNRLEAVLTMCRHEEFARDLMQIRKTVTGRSSVSQQASEPLPNPTKQGGGSRSMPRGMSVVRAPSNNHESR